MCKRPERRSTDQQEILDRLATTHPHIEQMSELALEFRNALHSNDGTRMLAWIDHAASSVHVPFARLRAASAET
jgi:transposase